MKVIVLALWSKVQNPFTMTSHPTRFRWLFISALTCCAATALANDTAVTLGAGGLVPIKTTAIVMEDEDLSISVREITVHYVFRNTSNKDIDAIIAFPLPDLNGGEVFNTPINLPDETELNFVRFSVSSAGVPIPVKVDARAFLDKADITARLDAAGLPVNVLLEPLNAALLRVPLETRQQLEKEQLIIPEEGFNPPLRSSGKTGWWATWTMRVQFYWEQRFPANSSVELTQTYRPIVGGSYIALDDPGETSIKPYCGTASTIRDIANVKKSHSVTTEFQPALFERRIDYVLTTGNNWDGAIRHFRVAVSTDNPDDIVLTCAEGFKRIGPTRYELVRSNFRPKDDLKLLILQPSAPENEPRGVPTVQ